MKRMRIFAMALAIALAGAWLFSGTLICAYARHQCADVVCACPESDCPHSRCGVCEIISACKNLFEGSAAGAAGIGCAFCIRAMRMRVRAGLACLRRSPVELRTMLRC